MTKKLDVVIPIKANVCYTVNVKEVTSEAIRQALLQKDASDWTVDPNFYEFLGSAYRDVVNKMTEREIRQAVVDGWSGKDVAWAKEEPMVFTSVVEEVPKVDVVVAEFMKTLADSLADNIDDEKVAEAIRKLVVKYIG